MIPCIASYVREVLFIKQMENNMTDQELIHATEQAELSVQGNIPLLFLLRMLRERLAELTGE